MKLTLLRPVLSLLPLAVFGCGSQASPDYKGDSLLSIRGSVTIENPDAPTDLVPALAFTELRADGVNVLHLMDADVHGEFPANFVLDVFTPPAPNPSVSVQVGRIVAVPADHPESFDMPSERDAPNTCQPPNAAGVEECIYDFVRCEGGESTQADITETEGKCWHEKRECQFDTTKAARMADALTCETVESWGNADYSKGIFEKIGGLARNYSVVYVQTPDPALELAFGGPLGVGYHLFQVSQLPVAEANANQACLSNASAAALDAYNAEHGTTWSSRDPQPDANTREELRQASIAAAKDAGCQWSSWNGFVYSPVPADTSIHVELGTVDIIGDPGLFGG